MSAILVPPTKTPGAAEAIATAAISSMSTPEDSVATPSEEVRGMRASLELVEALMGGTQAMRDAGVKYLPKWPAEDDSDWTRRKNSSTLFPAYKRTVTTLAAKPFSKPVTIGDDVPEPLKKLLDNVDMQGRNVDVYSAEMMIRVLGEGFAGIFVDYTRRPEGAGISRADDQDLEMRPYWVPIRLRQIIGWREGDRGQLTQLRIMERVKVDSGMWGTKTVDQVLVLEIGKWTRFQKTQMGRWEKVSEGVLSTKAIPFVPAYGERTGFMMSKPPLLELAYLNVKHWQSQSDQDRLLHVARVPILTLIGDTDTGFKLVIGGSVATKIPLGSELKFTEHSGAAITAGKVSLDDLKEEMRQSGAELLVLRPAPSTATEIASDNAVGMCALQETAQALEDCLDQALQFTAEWMGEELDAEAGHLTLFKDFGAATLAEASAQLLLAMSNSGKLSNETLIGELKRRGILNSEVEWDDEKERIDVEGPPVLPGDAGGGNRGGGSPGGGGDGGPGGEGGYPLDPNALKGKNIWSGGFGQPWPAQQK